MLTVIVLLAMHDKGLKAESLKRAKILNSDIHVVKPLSTKVLHVRVVLMNSNI